MLLSQLDLLWKYKNMVNEIILETMKQIDLFDVLLLDI